MRQAPRDYAVDPSRPRRDRRVRRVLVFLIVINPVLALAAVAVSLWRG